jgi:hypothetical protein
MMRRTTKRSQGRTASGTNGWVLLLPWPFWPARPCGSLLESSSGCRLALDDVVDLEHLGLTRKLDTNFL